MAERKRIALVDDLDGTPADEVVAFTVDGIDYSINLSGRNATNFREVMSEFTSAASRSTGRNRASGGLHSWRVNY